MNHGTRDMKVQFLEARGTQQIVRYSRRRNSRQHHRQRCKRDRNGNRGERRHGRDDPYTLAARRGHRRTRRDADDTCPPSGHPGRESYAAPTSAAFGNRLYRACLW